MNVMRKMLRENHNWIFAINRSTALHCARKNTICFDYEWHESFDQLQHTNWWRLHNISNKKFKMKKNVCDIGCEKMKIGFTLGVSNVTFGIFICSTAQFTDLQKKLKFCSNQKMLLCMFKFCNVPWFVGMWWSATRIYNTSKISAEF